MKSGSASSSSEAFAGFHQPPPIKRWSCREGSSPEWELSFAVAAWIRIPESVAHWFLRAVNQFFCHSRVLGPGWSLLCRVKIPFSTQETSSFLAVSQYVSQRSLPNCLWINFWIFDLCRGYNRINWLLCSVAVYPKRSAAGGFSRFIPGYTGGRDGRIDGEWHRFHIHHMHFIKLFNGDFFLLHQRVCIHIQRNVYTGMPQYFTCLLYTSPSPRDA